eukprot:scaffold3226_cov251-Pinguiococcus_pyrenoidosus.AAC.9
MVPIASSRHATYPAQSLAFSAPPFTCVPSPIATARASRCAEAMQTSRMPAAMCSFVGGEGCRSDPIRSKSVPVLPPPLHRSLRPYRQFYGILLRLERAGVPGQHRVDPGRLAEERGRSPVLRRGPLGELRALDGEHRRQGRKRHVHLAAEGTCALKGDSAAQTRGPPRLRRRCQVGGVPAAAKRPCQRQIPQDAGGLLLRIHVLGDHSLYHRTARGVDDSHEFPRLRVAEIRGQRAVERLVLGPRHPEAHVQGQNLRHTLHRVFGES